MRVLLAARYTIKQVQMGGVQSWIESVAAPMRADGHDVVTWGRGERTPVGAFDVGIFAHWAETGHLAPLCKRTVCVSHGPIAPEKPGPADRVYFTSEGVRDHWKGQGGIIRQPIDLDFWSPAQARRILLTRHSYRRGLGFVPGLASKFNLQYRHVTKETYRGVREALRQSAVVLATGRAALEAMACGCAVVLADHRHQYMPPLMHTGTPEEWMRENYSARGGVEPNQENVYQACCDALKAGSQRSWVESNHDSKAIAERLLSS